MTAEPLRGAARDHRLPRLPRRPGRRSRPATGGELVCQECGLAYPVRDDIPVLLVDEARRPGLTAHMATWFDESRLDDEGALAAGDLRLRTLAESGARVRREAGEAAAATAEAVARARELARPRAVIAAGPGLAAAARRARAVVPGAVRGLARTRRCPAGPAASTWSSCWPPTAPTPAPRRPSPRRSAAAARWSSPARRPRWSPSTRPAAGARSCRPPPATSSPPRS